ncbi:hypothetical protein BEST7613_4564 [Synechocystis sp. PCC 6803]|nr:hypothetical protein BEST7613_4564 [Synechocystis sp. PCC 6803] [Bacillus subtilis BEST7613]
MTVGSNRLDLRYGNRYRMVGEKSPFPINYSGDFSQKPLAIEGRIAKFDGSQDRTTAMVGGSMVRAIRFLPI